MDAKRPQSEPNVQDSSLDWMAALERMNAWALRLSRLQEEDVEEVSCCAVVEVGT